MATISLPIVFRAAAQAEFDEAAAWYEQQRPGLGADFVDKVQQVLDTVSAHPDKYPLAERDIREAPVSKFP